ncbi:MAG: alpha/beta fold hydrolase [Actinomycetota bacterium]|jgi:polyhydroxybutyrate depolymerase
MRFSLSALVLSCVVLAGCGTSGGSTNAAPSGSAAVTSSAPAATEPTAADTPTSTTIDPTIARPFDVFVPSTYNGTKAVPLVVLLHGYGASGAIQEAYFQIQPIAESHGFLYVHADGTKNATGSQFWNATDACCGGPAATVDDSAYITSIIESVQKNYKVDPKRIYVMGHSNGGFMSYRMACDHADKIAAIASLAGATFSDISKCAPSEPVSVLEIHGTGDQTIKYAGDQIQGRGYPGAQTTTATWAGYDGCAATSTTSPTKVDLEPGIDGAESSIAAFDGCPTGLGVELWSIEGGQHIPSVSPAFIGAIIDFLLAHPKA